TRKQGSPLGGKFENNVFVTDAFQLDPGSHVILVEVQASQTSLITEPIEIDVAATPTPTLQWVVQPKDVMSNGERVPIDVSVRFDGGDADHPATWWAAYEVTGQLQAGARTEPVKLTRAPGEKAQRFTGWMPTRSIGDGRLKVALVRTKDRSVAASLTHECR